MPALKELQEKRESLAAEIRTMADAFNAAGKKFSAEEETKWGEINAAYDANQTALLAEKKIVDDAAAAAKKQDADIEARLKALNSDEDIGITPGTDGGSIEDGPVHAERFNPLAKTTAEDQALAIQAWFRSPGGRRGEITDKHRVAARKCGISLQNGSELEIALNPSWRAVRQQYRQFRNTLGDKDGASGGYTYGETFVQQLELAMLAYGGMFDVASIIRTDTGAPMRWPTASDTSNTGRQLGESTAVTTTTDPTFGQVIWNSYKFSSDAVLVPYELIRDSAFDLASELAQMLGIRLGRIQNTKYTTGTGANTAKGITNCSSLGVTAASATAVVFDELIDLEHSLDPSRRKLPGVGYMFHDSILKGLRKLKDGMGRYLWQAGANTGAPDTLNTYPYTVNQDMQSSFASATKTILFGQFSQYKIRQVATMRMYRLQERYRDNDQDGFIAFTEGDGNLLDAGDHPVKHLLQAT